MDFNTVLLDGSELRYVATAKGASRWWQAQGRGIRLSVAAQGECTVGTHLMPTLLDLNSANSVEAD